MEMTDVYFRGQKWYGMWRTVPSMILVSNSFFSLSLPPILPPPSPDNEGQLIELGVEFGLPYDLTTALENPLGRTLTAMSVAAGGLNFGDLSLLGIIAHILFNTVAVVFLVSLLLQIKPPTITGKRSASMYIFLQFRRIHKVIS